MNKKAFTLIELLVTLLIFSIIMLFIYGTYTGLLFNFKDLTKQAQTQAQVLPALNVIRLDIEQAGYGLDPSIASNAPVTWDNATKTLTIRSVANTTNDNTLGWELVSCSATGAAPTILATSDNNSPFSTSANVVWLDAKQNNKFVANGVSGACPSGYNYSNDNNSVFLGFPYDNATSNGCIEQFCNIITYSLSSTQDIPTCNPDTRKLLRKVGSTLSGIPILNCVADFRVTIDNVSDPKLVNVYILTQEGRRERKYKFNASSLTLDGQVFNLSSISDYTHYKWKLIKLSVKPMSYFGAIP